MTMTSGARLLVVLAALVLAMAAGLSGCADEGEGTELITVEDTIRFNLVHIGEDDDRSMGAVGGVRASSRPDTHAFAQVVSLNDHRGLGKAIVQQRVERVAHEQMRWRIVSNTSSTPVEVWAFHVAPVGTQGAPEIYALPPVGAGSRILPGEVDDSRWLPRPGGQVEGLERAIANGPDILVMIEMLGDPNPGEEIVVELDLEFTVQVREL